MSINFFIGDILMFKFINKTYSVFNVMYLFFSLGDRYTVKIFKRWIFRQRVTADTVKSYDGFLYLLEKSSSLRHPFFDLERHERHTRHDRDEKYCPRKRVPDFVSRVCVRRV